jgi:transcriptional regulator with XRE-family HTH domain
MYSYAIISQQLKNIYKMFKEFNNMKNHLTETAKQNIARMKTHEGGNVHFANKLGISSGKTSQLTGRDTTISAHLLNLICENYKISESDFFTKQWKVIDSTDVFYDTYYAYFFTTWEDSDVKIDIAEVSVSNDRKIEFKINNKKNFSGTVFVEDTFFRAEMRRGSNEASENYGAMFVMPWNPALKPPKKYYGGLGLLFLPTDSELVPVAQKMVLSGVPLNIDKNSEDNEFVRNSLRLSGDSYKIKINIEDEKKVFYYLRKKMSEG